MKNLYFFFCVFFLCLFLSSCHQKEAYFQDALCISNINIIHPDKGLEKNINLVIRGNKIVQIDNAEKLIFSNKNRVIDGRGKFLIPGLWDSHVHFYFDPFLGKYMPDLFLSNGITSVRDTGGPFHFVDSIKKRSLSNPTIFPRVKIAGPLIDGKFNVYDGKNIAELSIQTIDVEDTRRKTQELVDNGVDFLKAYEMLSEAQFKEVAAIANKNNLRMAGHVPLSMDIITATELGLNSLEHIKNIELTALKSRDSLLRARRKMLENSSKLPGIELRGSIHRAQKSFAIKAIDSTELEHVLDVIKKNNSFQVPTLSIYKVPIYKIFKRNFWKQSFEMLPSKTKQLWLSREQQSTDNIDSDQKAFSDWIQQTVGQMNKKEITIMSGTDTPLGYLTPGFSLHYELELLVESGLSEIGAIQTATLHPAQYFRMEDSLGQIKKNYIADLVILNQNPLDDIKNTKAIDAVIKNGHYLSKQELDSNVLNK
tara:strand:- start:1026 stop:2468 length:1443 start_codon:yes stop_codon:yes gene_type:complete